MSLNLKAITSNTWPDYNTSFRIFLNPVNIDQKEFADLHGRMHGYDPETKNFVLWDTDTNYGTRYGETGRWLAKQWAIKETDPLVWLSSLSAAQVDRIQTKIEETVYGTHARN